MVSLEIDQLIEQAKAAYAAKNLKEAETTLRKVLGANPVHPEATYWFANICSRTGRASLALAYLNNLLKREPSSIRVLLELANLLLGEGKVQEAKAYGSRATDIAPEDPEVLCRYTQILSANGFIYESDELVHTAIEKHLNDANYLEGLARSLTSHGLTIPSGFAAERLVQIDPNDKTAWLILARAKLQSPGESAVECCLNAVRLDESSPDAQLLLATSLLMTGDSARAAIHFRRVIELHPGDSHTFEIIGQIMQQAGEFEMARDYLRKSVELRPANGFGHFLLMSSKRIQTEDEPLLEELEQLASDATATTTDQTYLQFAIAKGREDLGQFERATTAYDKANRLSYEQWFANARWDKTAYHEDFSRTIQLFTPELIERLSASGNLSKKPLLIVGMPRSGTTLVEQIISSHEAIAAGGELEFWARQGSKVIDLVRQQVEDSSYALITAAYLDVLAKFGPSAERVTDKMPQNFVALGLICSAFPNARVIHVQRDPFDNCLSIYTTAFGRPPVYTTRRKDIIFAYREYYRMMDHWRSVLKPHQLLEIRYEQLVANPEITTRRMIEFVGVPWSDACLHHESNQRSVQTASTWQVRQPLYRSSVDRWQDFRQWMPEFEALTDLLRIDFQLL